MTLDMITEIIRYTIPEDQAEAFEHAYGQAEAILQSSGHCLGYKLLSGHEEPENRVLLIEWDSLEGHEQGFRKEPGFREFFALVKPFFNNIQEMKHYEVTRIRWQRAA